MGEAQQAPLLIDVSRETIRALEEMSLRRFLDCMALMAESSFRVGTVTTVLAGRLSGHRRHLRGMSWLEVLGLLVWLCSVQAWSVGLVQVRGCGWCVESVPWKLVSGCARRFVGLQRHCVVAWS